MKEINWLPNNRIKVEPPARPKKITGTRFAAVLGKNPWATEFETWCAITRTYEEPFVDTIYTKAGKAIEPKQAEYMRNAYGMTLISPEDRYGKDYFKKTFGDFFPEEEMFGGMWDYLAVNEETGEVDTVLEMKTTKRAEDWEKDIPEYYALQAALYAWLLKVDNVIMVCSILSEKDYEAPEKFEPSVGNTITVSFNLWERYPYFDQMVEEAAGWWEKYVRRGVSPKYDEKRDAKILAALKTTSLNPDTDMEQVIKEAEELTDELTTARALIASTEKRLKELQEIIKKSAINELTDGVNKVTVSGAKYEWTLSKFESTEIDRKALEADGLLTKYGKVRPSYRLTVNERKNA